jgi:hypothetical protein
MISAFEYVKDLIPAGVVMEINAIQRELMAVVPRDIGVSHVWAASAIVWLIRKAAPSSGA